MGDISKWKNVDADLLRWIRQWSVLWEESLFLFKSPFTIQNQEHTLILIMKIWKISWRKRVMKAIPQYVIIQTKLVQKIYIQILQKLLRAGSRISFLTR